MSHPDDVARAGDGGRGGEPLRNAPRKGAAPPPGRSAAPAAEGARAAALVALYAEEYPRLVQAVRRRMGPRLRRLVDAEDVLQETFLAASDRVAAVHVEERAQLAAWVLRIAERKILDAARYFRRRRRHRTPEEGAVERSLEDVALGDDALGNVGGSPWERSGALQRLVDRESVSRTYQQLGHLAPDQRDVLLLRDFFGVSWPVVADTLGGRSIGAVMKLHARAREQLALGLRTRRPDPPAGPFAGPLAGPAADPSRE